LTAIVMRQGLRLLSVRDLKFGLVPRDTMDGDPLQLSRRRTHQNEIPVTTSANPTKTASSSH